MINGSGKKQNNLLVQKSHPLMKLSELSLAEFKILDVYLSRINSRNPEDRTVCFEKGELEELLLMRLNYTSKILNSAKESSDFKWIT